MPYFLYRGKDKMNVVLHKSQGILSDKPTRRNQYKVQCHSVKKDNFVRGAHVDSLPYFLLVVKL